jgi:hypothetical protein
MYSEASFRLWLRLGLGAGREGGLGAAQVGLEFISEMRIICKLVWLITIKIYSLLMSHSSLSVPLMSRQTSGDIRLSCGHRMLWPVEQLIKTPSWPKCLYKHPQKGNTSASQKPWNTAQRDSREGCREGKTEACLQQVE